MCFILFLDRRRNNFPAFVGFALLLIFDVEQQKIKFSIGVHCINLAKICCEFWTLLRSQILVNLPSWDSNYKRVKVDFLS